MEFYGFFTNSKKFRTSPRIRIVQIFSVRTDGGSAAAGPKKYNRLTPSVFTFIPHFVTLFNDLKENDRVLRKEHKEKIISTNKVHATDTGSAEVQIALLSERISQLTRHMTSAKKDFHSRAGLMKLVGQRKRLLAYLKKEDSGRYERLIQKLGLRK